MKLTENEIRNIVKKNLLIKEEIKKGNLFTKIRDFFVHSDIGRDKKSEEDVRWWINSWIDKLDDHDRKIAEDNFEKLRKNRKLFKALCMKKHKYGISQEAKDGRMIDAIVMSYLLEGHPDFKGKSREQIENYLEQEIEKTLYHKVLTKNEKFRESKIKYIEGEVEDSEHKKILNSFSGVQNLISKAINLKARNVYKHKVGKSTLTLFFKSIKYKNIPSHKYGVIEKEGTGLSASISIVKVYIDDNKMAELLLMKNMDNLKVNKKSKIKAARKSGLYIDGTHSYCYGGKYSNKFSKPGAYEKAIKKISESIRNLKSKMEPERIINEVLKHYLKQLDFNSDDFKNKFDRPRRQEVLIDSNGKSIVGSDKIDKYFAQNLPKIKYKKVK